MKKAFKLKKLETKKFMAESKGFMPKINKEKVDQENVQLVKNDLKMKNSQDNLLLYIGVYIESQKQKSKNVTVSAQSFISLFPHLKEDQNIEFSFINGLKDLVQEECCEQENKIVLYHPFLKQVKMNPESKACEIELNEKLFSNVDYKTSLVPIDDLLKFFQDERKLIETKLKKPESIGDWYKIIFFLYIFLGKNYLRMKVFDKNINELSIDFRKNDEVYQVSQKNNGKQISSFPKYVLEISFQEFVIMLKHYLKFLRKNNKINWYEITPKKENLLVEVSLNKMILNINFKSFLDNGYNDDLFLFI